jgi:hypothetical protein
MATRKRRDVFPVENLSVNVAYTIDRRLHTIATLEKGRFINGEVVDLLTMFPLCNGSTTSDLDFKEPTTGGMKGANGQRKKTPILQNNSVVVLTTLNVELVDGLNAKRDYYGVFENMMCRNDMKFIFNVINIENLHFVAVCFVLYFTLREMVLCPTVTCFGFDTSFTPDNSKIVGKAHMMAKKIIAEGFRYKRFPPSVSNKKKHRGMVFVSVATPQQDVRENSCGCHAAMVVEKLVAGVATIRKVCSAEKIEFSVHDVLPLSALVLPVTIPLVRDFREDCEARWSGRFLAAVAATIVDNGVVESRLSVRQVEEILKDICVGVSGTLLNQMQCISNKLFARVSLQWYGNDDTAVNFNTSMPEYSPSAVESVGVCNLNIVMTEDLFFFENDDRSVTYPFLSLSPHGVAADDYPLFHLLWSFKQDAVGNPFPKAGQVYSMETPAESPWEAFGDPVENPRESPWEAFGDPVETHLEPPQESFGDPVENPAESPWEAFGDPVETRLEPPQESFGDLVVDWGEWGGFSAVASRASSPPPALVESVVKGSRRNHRRSQQSVDRRKAKRRKQ